MAAKRDAVLNSYDDDLLSNIGGSISNLESNHGPSFYTYITWPIWNYVVIYPDVDRSEGELVEDIRVFPRVPKERVI